MWIRDSFQTLHYECFFELLHKAVVHASDGNVLRIIRGADNGAVGGIRTLGRLLAVTRFPVVLVMTTSILLHILFPVPRRQMPVSYTHLDVYKRQGENIKGDLKRILPYP